MAGHMHHPPYPWWAYAIDGAWVICFGGAIILAVAAPHRVSVAGYIVTIGFLIVSRLTGFLSYFMLPAEFIGVAVLIRFICAQELGRLTVRQKPTAFYE